MVLSADDGSLIGGGALFLFAAVGWFFGLLFNVFHRASNPESALRFKGKRQLGFSFNERIRIAVIGMVVAGLIMEANRAWGWHDCPSYWTFFYVTLTGAVVAAVLFYALLREVGRGAFILPIGIIFGSLFAAGLTHQIICLQR